MAKRKKPTPAEAAASIRAQIQLVRTQLDGFESQLDQVFPIATTRRSVKAIVKTACGKVISAGRKVIHSRALLIIVFGVGLVLGASL